MMIRTMLKCLTLLLLWPMMAMAEGNDVGTLLERFNQSANVSTANEFFRGLKAEGLTDSLYQYQAGTPVEVLQSSVWYWAAEWFYDRQNYDQAEAYGLKALPLFTPDGNSDTTQQGDLLNLLAITFTRQGEFTQAAKYAKMCNELDLASGNPDNIASSLNTLAGIYLSARQPEKAEEYVLKGIEYARQTDNQARQAVADYKAKINAKVKSQLAPTKILGTYSTSFAWQGLYLPNFPELNEQYSSVQEMQFKTFYEKGGKYYVVKGAFRQSIKKGDVKNGAQPDNSYWPGLETPVEIPADKIQGKF